MKEVRVALKPMVNAFAYDYAQADDKFKQVEERGQAFLGTLDHLAGRKHASYLPVADKWGCWEHDRRVDKWRGVVPDSEDTKVVCQRTSQQSLARSQKKTAVKQMGEPKAKEASKKRKEDSSSSQASLLPLLHCCLRLQSNSLCLHTRK